MAKIEMDLSEFKQMEKNAQLLEEALAREKDQSDELDKLRKEKIRILESNSKKVVTIVEHRTQETKLVRRDALDIMSRLRNIFLDEQRGIRRGAMSGPMSGGMSHSRSDTEYLVERMIDTCFTPATLESEPTKTVNVVGLDDVKRDLKKKLKEELDSDTKAKLRKYELLLENYNKTTKDLRDSRAIVNQLNSSIETKNNDLELLEDKLEHSEESYNSLLLTMKDLRSIIETGRITSFFGAKGVLRNLIKKYDKWQS